MDVLHRHPGLYPPHYFTLWISQPVTGPQFHIFLIFGTGGMSLALPLTAPLGPAVTELLKIENLARSACMPIYDVGHSYRRLFLRLFVLHFSLTIFSINSPQLLLTFAVVLHSPSTLSRSISLNTVLKSHSRSSSPHFVSTHWASDLFYYFYYYYYCQFFVSHSFHMTSPFTSYPHQFLLKSFNYNVQPPPSVHPFFSYTLSSLPPFFLSSCVSQTCTFYCC